MFDAGLAPQEIVQKVAVEEPIRFIQWEAQNRIFAFRDDENNTWLVDLCPTSHQAYTAEFSSSDNPPLSLVGARVLRVGTFGNVRGRTHGSVQIRKAGMWAIADLSVMHEIVCSAKARERGDIHEVRGSDEKSVSDALVGKHAPKMTVCFLSLTKEGISQ
ncbi:hypothetical protein BC835DRAFT_231504 [Cytidiella melzeri]|nr:hypothetical protein BC835DRAFT_231504 [Cytidiella melzeri]